MATLTQDVRLVLPLIDRKVVVLYLGVLLGTLPTWPFEVHLALHILGAILLIGNAFVMAAWLVLAGNSSRDDRKRRAAVAVNVGDIWATVPGVLLLLANGLAMVGQRYGGEVAFSTVPFIGVGLVLLNLTGLIWLLRLVPIQLHMLRLARADGPFDDRSFRRSLIGWSLWGIVATAMPIAAVVLMVVKPALW